MIQNMAHEQQDRWNLTDIEVPFKCVLWWMMKVGATLLIVGGSMSVIVKGVLAIPSFIIPQKEVGNPDIVGKHHFSVAARMQQMAISQFQSSSVAVNSQPQPVVIQANQQPQGNVQVWTQPVPSSPPSPVASSSQQAKGEELSIFLDKPQQISNQFGTHRISIHDHGSETISFSIDGQQVVRMKKANGSDLAGDNKVMIFNDGRMAIFHVNSARAPQNCCLIRVVPVTQL